MPGATFTLTDLNGDPVVDIFGNVVTPRVGSTFSFSFLLPGSYIVTETNPPFFVSTNAIPGPAGGVKLDNDQIRIDAVEGSYPENNFLDTRVFTCLDLTKTVDPATAKVGQSVTYTFKICNCGSRNLTINSVIDDLLGDLTQNFIDANGGSSVLLSETCVTFQVEHLVAESSALPVTNTVTVNATDTSGVTISDSTDATLTVELDRRCFLPVTFTAQGWHDYCDISNPVIPGGMVYGKFQKAFAGFEFFGTPSPNKLIVGGRKTITFEGTTSGLTRMCIFLGQDGPCGKLIRSYLNPWNSTEAGVLAVETVALMLNLAYNDMRLMPRTPGYDLELFTLRDGLLRGKTVGEVLNIANRVLDGEAPCSVGLPDCGALVDILRSINANYEFAGFLTFNDRGYLIPNQSLGQSGPPHPPVVPY